jgi:hypothetical protein
LKFSTEKFSIGLYAASEMFVESFWICIEPAFSGELRRAAPSYIFAFFLGSSGFYRTLRGKVAILVQAHPPICPRSLLRASATIGLSNGGEHDGRAKMEGLRVKPSSVAGRPHPAILVCAKNTINKRVPTLTGPSAFMALSEMEAVPTRTLCPSLS